MTVRYQDLQRQLSETNAAIGEVNGRIGSLASAAELDASAGSTGTRSSSTPRSDRCSCTMTMLKRRLVDIYEYGDLSYLNALIASRSFSEFVERWEDLRLLIAANQRAVRARKAAAARVAAIEADLERTRLELQQAGTGARRGAQPARLARATNAATWSSSPSIRRRSVASEVAQMEDLSAAEEASAREA